MTLATLRSRRDTAANWSAANPILSLGEVGWETDNLQGKVGDGTSLWSALPYLLGAPDFLYTSVKSKQFKATGDGTTNDTAAIAAAIASAAKNLFFPAGTYLIDNQVLNQAGQNIILAPGATVKGRAGGGQTVFEVTAANVSITGYGATIDGNNQGSSVGSTVWTHATDTRIEGVLFINMTGIGINCANSTRPKVINNTIISSGGNAGIFTSASGASAVMDSPYIHGNYVILSGGVGYGIQLHNDSGGITNHPRVTNNYVVLPKLVTSGIGIEIQGGCKYGSVGNNTVEGGSIAISLDFATSVTATGNSVRGSYLYGLEMASCFRCVGTGNTIDLTQTGSIGISVSNSSGGWNTLSGNDISAPVGIYSQDVSGQAITITGNNVTCFGAGSASIVVASNSGHTVTGNSCFGSAGANVAIQGDNITNSIIANNTATNFGVAVVAVFNGTMNGLIVGPNVAAGTTPKEMTEWNVDGSGWHPGTNGVGSRFFRAKLATLQNTLTPTASPWTWTNDEYDQYTVYIRGGTVSNVTKNGVSLAVASPATIRVESGQSIIVTYSVLPTVVYDRGT